MLSDTSIVVTYCYLFFTPFTKNSNVRSNIIESLCGVFFGSKMSQKMVLAQKIFLVLVPIFIVIVENVSEHADPDYYVPPRYKFDYSVHDPDSGDVKSHWESRDGDEVIGAYTVHDPDGVIRMVEYRADPDHGFNAQISKQKGQGGGRESGGGGGGGIEYDHESEDPSYSPF